MQLQVEAQFLKTALQSIQYCKALCCGPYAEESPLEAGSLTPDLLLLKTCLELLFWHCPNYGNCFLGDCFHSFNEYFCFLCRSIGGKLEFNFGNNPPQTHTHTKENKSKSSYEIRFRSKETIQVFNMAGSLVWLLNSFKAIPKVIYQSQAAQESIYCLDPKFYLLLTYESQCNLFYSWFNYLCLILKFIVA